MSIICTTPEELAEAIERREDSIIIKGDLENKIFIIKITGKVAWTVCAAALAIAIACYIATPEAAVVTAPAGGVGGVISFTGGMASTAVAATTLGTAVGPAVAIGVAAGGIGVLNTLRDRYDIVERTGNYIRLQLK